MSKKKRVYQHRSSFFDSNRKGHMTAAFAVGATLFAYGLSTQTSFLIRTGLFIPIFEYIATPDHDHDSRKIRGSMLERLWLIWWSPFKHAIPHRGRFSHSLLLGTPFRLAYASVPFIAIASVAFPQQASNLINLIQSDPASALSWGAQFDWIWASAFIADAVHLAKDNFWPWEMMLGKNPLRLIQGRRKNNCSGNRFAKHGG